MQRVVDDIFLFKRSFKYNIVTLLVASSGNGQSLGKSEKERMYTIKIQKVRVPKQSREPSPWPSLFRLNLQCLHPIGAHGSRKTFLCYGHKDWIDVGWDGLQVKIRRNCDHLLFSITIFQASEISWWWPVNLPTVLWESLINHTAVHFYQVPDKYNTKKRCK